jgi:DNA relaxase NicK
MNKATAPHTVEEIRAGVDWISCTLLKDEPSVTGFWLYARSCIQAVAREGNELEERSMLGFTGIKAGGCFTGDNEQRVYLQLAGEYADRWYDAIDTYQPHYSRLDLQVTVKYVKEQLTIAKDAYNDFLSGNEELSTPSRRKGYIIIGSDGGDTCYLGAPSSRQRCRIYNKAKQSERAAYERCWRYEIVLRNELAREWASLQRRGRLQVAESCVETVGQWLEARGISVPFCFRGDVAVLPKVRTLPTDVERKIEWLRTQVRPTVQYLTELGFESILLEALGIELRPLGPCE